MIGVGVQICRGSFVFGRLMYHTLVTIDDLLWCRLICFVEIFPTVSLVLSSEFRCTSKFFLFFYFLLSPLSSQITRKKEIKKKKKISEVYRNFSHNNISIIRKISKKWIQRHKKRLLMMTGVCHTCLDIFR